MTKRIAIAELEGKLAASQREVDRLLLEKRRQEFISGPSMFWLSAVLLVAAILIVGSASYSMGRDSQPSACRAIVAAHNPSGFVEVPDELVEGE